jgi:hypothetical protein
MDEIRDGALQLVHCKRNGSGRGQPAVMECHDRDSQKPFTVWSWWTVFNLLYVSDLSNCARRPLGIRISNSDSKQQGTYGAFSSSKET